MLKINFRAKFHARVPVAVARLDAIVLCYVVICDVWGTDTDPSGAAGNDESNVDASLLDHDSSD